MYMHFNLTRRQARDIGGALDEDALKGKIRRKLLALKMRDAGAPLEMIASSLSVSIRTVSNYISEFLEGGLRATLEDRAYVPESCLDPYFGKLEESFRKEPVGCAKQARVRIVKLTGIELSPRQVRRVMRSLGMRYRKAGQIPGKADGQRQMDFLEEELRPKLEEAARGERRVFFVDAAHFVMGAVVGMLWSFGRVFVRGASAASATTC
jgi:transposase